MGVLVKLVLCQDMPGCCGSVSAEVSFFPLLGSICMSLVGKLCFTHFSGGRSLADLRTDLGETYDGLGLFNAESIRFFLIFFT